MTLCIHSSDPAKRDPRGCSQCLGAEPSVSRKIGQLPAGETVDTDELFAMAGYDGSVAEVRNTPRERRENRTANTPKRVDTRTTAEKRSAAAKARWNRGTPPGYYTTTDLARLTGLTSQAARHAAKVAGLVVLKQEQCYLFAKDAVDAWLQEREARRSQCPAGHITVAQLAERTGLPRRNVSSDVSRGRIASTLINGSRYVPETEVARLRASASRPGALSNDEVGTTSEETP